MAIGALHKSALRTKQAAGRAAVVTQQPFLMHATENDKRYTGAWSPHRHVVAVHFVAASHYSIVDRIYSGAVQRCPGTGYRHVQLRSYLAQA